MAKLLRPSTICALVIGAAAIAVPRPAIAVETIGGRGGEPFQTRCEGDRFLVGVTGRAGEWMIQIAPICVRTNAHGQWIEPPRTGPAVGGTGGQSFFIVCPADSVVTGYYGRGGDYVGNIGLTCKREGPAGAEWSWPWPGWMRSTLDFDSSERGSCPHGQAANAITGRSSRFIDRFGVGCVDYEVTTPPSFTGVSAAPSDRPGDPRGPR